MKVIIPCMWINLILLTCLRI